MKPFDEMLLETDGVRDPYQRFNGWFQEQNVEELTAKAGEAEAFFRKTGITFNVYGEEEAAERLIPFDLVPRILAKAEWDKLAEGIEQRVEAMNAFLHDIYHDQEIVKAGKVPERLIVGNEAYLPQMEGFSPPGGVYTHIIGTDIVRCGENEFFVLEDNARTPSGVSYMIENRETMMQMFPELFSQNRVRPVETYPHHLRRSLSNVAPPACEGKPTVAVLTPGIHNSAFYEHAFLADQMGVELIEGSDVAEIDGRIQMRTTEGYKIIDVIYRRVDDEYLDPKAFNPDSMLGIPGIMEVYKNGGITIANAPGPE